MKLLIIGFDALDYEIYKKYKLENFELKKMKIFSDSTLFSWNSMYTGVHPKELFKYLNADWTKWLDKAGRKEDFPYPYFWEILNRNKIKVELMNLPATYPPKPVDYYIVSGFPLPSIYCKDYYYPPTLPIENNFISKLTMIFWDEKNWQKAQRQWDSELKRKLKVEETLRKNTEDAFIVANKFIELHKDAQLGFIYYEFVDCIGHLRAGLEEHYPLVNKLISYLTEKLKPEATLILSDHGFRDKNHTPDAVCCFKGNIDIPSEVETTDVFNIVLKTFKINL
jgi:predicted AlkP superfamily phosphohydrolase/phosphomutase